MSRTQRSISIKNQILNKLHLNQIQGNPICPVAKPYRIKTGKVTKRSQTIMEQEISSIRSINLIKPYKTEKIIRIQSAEYSISMVLQSQSYKKLQSKLVEMVTNFNLQKHKLNKQIKKLDKSIYQHTSEAQNLCTRLVRLDNTYEELENEYYQIRRRNYELKTQLSARRDPLQHILNNRRIQEPLETIDLDDMNYEQILEMEERLGKQNVGLSSDMIAKLKIKRFKSLKKFNVNDEINCCICCQNIEKQNKVIELDCQHVHHAQCIKHWLKIKRCCPLCKGQVEINEK